MFIKQATELRSTTKRARDAVCCRHIARKVSLVCLVHAAETHESRPWESGKRLAGAPSHAPKAYFVAVHRSVSETQQDRAFRVRAAVPLRVRTLIAVARIGTVLAGS